jgi:hypothetical protein
MDVGYFRDGRRFRLTAGTSLNMAIAMIQSPSPSSIIGDPEPYRRGEGYHTLSSHLVFSPPFPKLIGATLVALAYPLTNDP